VQVDSEAEASVQGGLRGRVAGDSDNAPLVRARSRGSHRGRLRGLLRRAPRHGALRGRRALRPDRPEGPLQ